MSRAINLHHQLDNGGTVADWLGTSETAAKVAAATIYNVRCGFSRTPAQGLLMARDQLVQALDELDAVLGETGVLKFDNVGVPITAHGEATEAGDEPADVRG